MTTLAIILAVVFGMVVVWFALDVVWLFLRTFADLFTFK